MKNILTDPLFWLLSIPLMPIVVFGVHKIYLELWCLTYGWFN